MNKTSFFLLVAPLFITPWAFGQELPRSASFGAMITNVNDSIKTALTLPSSSGTLIKKVLEGSSAQKAGFSANDVLVSMNAAPIENTGEFLALMKKYHGGDNVNITFYRNSKLKKTTVSLLPK